MNKAALRQFAVNARKELLQKVQTRALKLGLTESSIDQASTIFIDGKPLTAQEQHQRQRLIAKIKKAGFHQVMEEAAYTWFNRLTALHFMEVNDYLPTRVRVLSSSIAGHTEPDMIKEALSLDMEIDQEYVYELKLNNETDQLFKYLIIKHCQELNQYLPFMFETIDDAAELLFPDGLLAKDSFLQVMIETIPESDWTQIEVIGWLYQYYIAEEKDRVFRERKKYNPEEIPFATQLFTPDWIVRFLVQNSLGRYWIERHPNQKDLADNWEFYIDKDTSSAESIEIEDIKCMDPAMGSGHMLVYLFDVLYEIYRQNGYLERDIPRLIIEHNLYGLDIDRRAYQLACFSIVMKAMEYNPRFLRHIKKHGLRINLAVIEETNGLTDEEIVYFSGEEHLATIKPFVNQFQDAKSIGSLIRLEPFDEKLVQEKLRALQAEPADDLFSSGTRDKLLPLFENLLKQTELLKQTYDIVITNPPYMGTKSMNKPLAQYLQKHYPDSKADLFAAFMEIHPLMKQSGFFACINQHSWMFLSSFEKLRKKIIETKQVEVMVHLGPRAFEEIGGEVVQTTAFVFRNEKSEGQAGVYIRTVEEKTAAKKREKVMAAVENRDLPYCYSFHQINFTKIPSYPFAYWASPRVQQIFAENRKLGEMANPRQGLATGNNQRFIREWFEVDVRKIGFDFPGLEEARASSFKWFPMNKGGSFRKWYGNNESVLAFDEENYDILAVSGNKLPSRQFYFKEGITWSKVSSATFSVRYSPPGFIFSDAGMKVFVDEEWIGYLCAFLNSKLVDGFLNVLSETMNYEKGNIERLPIITDVDPMVKDAIEALFQENIQIVKRDWDAFETSWDFTTHPLLKHKQRNLRDSFAAWRDFTHHQFQKLKQNEEKLNEMFIDIYQLQDEMTPEVSDEEISIRKADVVREVKSFISYAIGCAFGRYSLDEEGLIFAGGSFDDSRYRTFQARDTHILPVIGGGAFAEDIVSTFIEFLKVTYGLDTLDENLNFVADVLGRKTDETAMECIRRYFFQDFYKDHVRIYRNRPIYWLFTSGKEKAFQCLVYMHRYDRTTLARMRTDYVHKWQNRLTNEHQDGLKTLELPDASSKEVNQAKRALRTIEKQLDELKKYDERLHHMADQQIDIDLDDGVLVNYGKFAGLVAKL